MQPKSSSASLPSLRDEEVAGMRIGVDLAAHEDLRGDLADELAEQAIALGGVRRDRATR